MLHYYVRVLFTLLVASNMALAQSSPPPIGGSTHCPVNGHLTRLCPAEYADGDYSMQYADRPDCCDVQAGFFAEYDQPNVLGLSEMVMIVGQIFWSHTNALTPDHNPTADALLTCTNRFKRAPFDENANEHGDHHAYANLVSSCTDGSFVYGSSVEHLNVLRAFEGGRLREHDRMPGYPPVNCPELGMANIPGKPQSELFCLGDIRGNENVFLTSIHILFFREHNRLARQLEQEKPTWSDQQLFDKARALLIAQQQKMAFYDYTEAILGKERVPAEYSGYKDLGAVAVPVEFSQAVFRINHAQIAHDALYFVNDAVTERFSLERFFFNTGEVASRGIDGFLQGLLHQPAQEIGWRTASLMVNENIIAADVCRSRDFGMPDYKTATKLLLNKDIESVDDITTDRVTKYTLLGLYGPALTNIDLFIGGLSEDKLPNAQMGPLFAHIYLETIQSVRDQDPYWFENELYTYLSEADKQWVWSRTLADVILDNTQLSCVQQDVLHMPHLSALAYQQESYDEAAQCTENCHEDVYMILFIVSLCMIVLIFVVVGSSRSIEEQPTMIKRRR